MATLAGGANAQAPRSVRDGVYGEAQAARGQDAFQANCSACHGFDMTGTAGGPQLVGGLFMLHWGDKPASEIFGMMRKQMPPNSPGGLAAETYVDILAAIFQANRFPPGGSSDLVEEDLPHITITRRKP